jgi:hypothetical protein
MFLTTSGYSNGQTDENSNGIPNWGNTSDGFGTMSGANLQNAFFDAYQEARLQNLPGVLSGGVCTESGLVVTVPAGTVYVAGGQVWSTASGETVGVADDATTYIWGQRDGLLAITATTSPPPGFEDGGACLLVKAVAAAGVVTLDLSVQHRARTPDYTERTIREGGIVLGNGAGQQRGRASVSYASDANKTLTQAEVECLTIDVGSGTALTVTRNLVFPLSDGAWWFVNNQSTGGQSIQCIGSSGTGITIAAAKGAWIWSDGINVKRGSADVTV